MSACYWAFSAQYAPRSAAIGHWPIRGAIFMGMWGVAGCKPRCGGRRVSRTPECASFLSNGVVATPDRTSLQHHSDGANDNFMCDSAAGGHRPLSPKSNTILQRMFFEEKRGNHHRKDAQNKADNPKSHWMNPC